MTAVAAFSLSAGLLATPAQAAVPTVRVTGVQSSPVKYTGPCPASVTFSATVSVKGASTVRYRWVRGDGSSGPVTTVRAGAKIKLRDRQTFTRSTRGWQAVQVLSPVKLTTRRAAFSVSCEGPEEIHSPKPPSGGQHQAPKASARVTGDSYSGPCRAPGRTLTFSGTVQVSRVPAAVSYRWADSDGGVEARQDLWFSAKDSPRRTVGSSRTFLASASGSRWIEILDRDGRVLSTSNRAPYSVTCAATPAPATASVTGLKVTPATFQGPCTAPVDFTFTADVAASRPTVVTYVWLRGDGTRTPGRWEFKNAGDLTRTVSHTWRVTDPAKLAGGSASIRITSPGRSKAGPVEFTIKCQGLTATGDKVLSPTPQPYTGVCPATVKTSAAVTVTGGPATVEYYWKSPVTPVQRTSVSGTATLTREWSQTSDATGRSGLLVRFPDGPWIESEGADWSVTCEAAEPEAVTVSKPVVTTWSAGGGECTTKNPYQVSAASMVTAPKGMTFPFDLTYRWRWADGGSWQQETVRITGSSAQRLLHTWYTSRSQAGRIFVDVLSPTQVRSEATEYSVTCDGKPPVPNTGGSVVSVTDPRITPSSYTGACPVDLKATATITVSAPTAQPVEYAWVFDNGTSSPTEKIDFPAGGPLTKTAVWDSWRAIKSSGPVTGYLVILSPNPAASDTVSYSVNCT
ncbi:hypothetical protein [Streptosporangium carneum]|uniref:hypothetical protein n=1 Tax=Streptosporangium carneum TaxID=47481 RepID=UPI0022F33AD8|nr:hypothetical protein [Streptosporangium carneum]